MLLEKYAYLSKFSKHLLTQHPPGSLPIRLFVLLGWILDPDRYRCETIAGCSHQAVEQNSDH